MSGPFSKPHHFQVLLAMILLIGIPAAVAQENSTQENGTQEPASTHEYGSNRKIRVKVIPNRPELARKFNISGVVRLQVTVAPNGTVKDVRAIGGHPALIDSAVNAVKEWKYEPASKQTINVVEITFQPAS